MARFDLQPAYILHQTAYRNTSLLLEVFSREHGRLALVARGGRRARQSALMQPFLSLRLSWSLKHDLGTLIAAEAARQSWRLNGKTAICGFYLNELLMRLCHRHDPHPDLFEAYEQALGELVGESIEIGLRRFEMRLLSELGYGLQLQTDADAGRPLSAQANYLYRPEIGPVSMDALHAEDRDGVVVSGRTLLALAVEDLSEPGVLRESRRLLKACLQPLLGEKSLRSREVYAAMIKLEQSNVIA